MVRVRVDVRVVTAVVWLACGCSGSHPPAVESTGPEPMQVAAGSAGGPATERDFHNPTPLMLPVFPEPAIDPHLLEPGPPAGNGRIVSDFLSDADDAWLTLIEVDWELLPGQEDHLCARMRVERGEYLHEFMPLSPLGTHHTQLSVYDSADLPDGVTSCGPDIGGHHIYGAGVGSESFALPEGIAMRIEEGQQVLLNLHLFNTGAEPLSGRSGVRVRIMPEAEVENLAEIVLGGPQQLTIPPGRVTQTGQCTFGSDATIFNLAPHMHQLGVHLRAVAMTQPSEIVLYDGPFAFDLQQRHPVDFVQVRAGEAVRIECTYENSSDNTVGFGLSSLDEMCFASMMRFPAQGGYLCTD